MSLQLEPFEQIRSGTKNIEIRLFDKKRQQLQIGDLIVFTQISDDLKSLEVEVTDLVPFKTFKDLFSAYNPNSYGGKSEDEYKSMFQYYSFENEQRYGVLAIHLKII